MKYAWTPEIKGDHESWSLVPWKKRGLTVYDRLSDIPSDCILMASHYAPWWSGLREWIAEGRPWIEIEYGYWGRDEKTRQTRRVTYCGHHNLNMRPRPYARSHLFDEPQIQPWRQTPGQYVLGILPINQILIDRTGQDIVAWQQHMESTIKKYWAGEILWRPKTGSRRTRFSFFQQQCKNAHAVVGERTMACTEAVILGVPAYTLDRSMSSLLMGGIENLANPQYPDRADWWDHVCWSQFHNHEFADDKLVDLVEQYQIHK